MEEESTVGLDVGERATESSAVEPAVAANTMKPAVTANTAESAGGDGNADAEDHVSAELRRAGSGP